MFEAITQWDMSVIDFLYENMRNPILDVFFSSITRLGDAGIFWILCAVVCLITKKYRKMGVMVGLALLIGLIIGNGIVKNAVGRMRPYEKYDQIHQTVNGRDTLVGPQSDKSFPSGHTQGSFAAATVLFIILKKKGIPFMVLASLIGFSRLYLYVHYPTDVIVGMIFGISWAIISVKIVNYVYKKYNLEQV
jgi:undecaprenyl-diphosphatase